MTRRLLDPRIIEVVEKARFLLRFTPNRRDDSISLVSDTIPEPSISLLDLSLALLEEP